MLFFAGDPLVRERCREWLAEHPDAPGVASAEGRMLAVRRAENRFSREVWEGLLAGDPGLRSLMVCPAITGLAPGPSERPARPAPPRPKAPVRTQGPVGKVISYLAAELGPRLDEAAARRRLEQCLKNECGHLRAGCSGKLFCGGCGCGGRPRAELHTKTRMAWARCPAIPSYWEGLDDGGTGEHGRVDGDGTGAAPGGGAATADGQGPGGD